MNQNEEQSVNTDSAAEKPQEKFKNGEQLAQAYANLEAEFTRRSQRLSELIRENEEMKKRLENGQAETQWAGTLADFWRQYPGAQRFSEQICQRLETGEKTEEALRAVSLAVLSEQAAEQTDPAADETFMQTHVFNNPEICDKIVVRYLQGLNEGAPTLLFEQEGSLPASPRRNARTLDEAGSMTLGLFKK